MRNALSHTNLFAMDRAALQAILSSDPIKGTHPKPPALNTSAGTAIIPIIGPISKYGDPDDGSISTLDLQRQIQAAIDDAGVSRVVLYFDSPGGTVSGTSALAAYILAAKAQKPIVAYISDNCYSAAYWIASQCTTVLAGSAAYIGSIGVYSVLVDSSEAAKVQGISLRLIAQGEFKGAKIDGLPISNAAVLEEQRRVGSSCDLFVNAIALGRGISKSVAQTWADGRVFIASEALKLGMIDAICTIEQAMGGYTPPLPAPLTFTPAMEAQVRSIQKAVRAISRTVDEQAALRAIEEMNAVQAREKNRLAAERQAKFDLVAAALPPEAGEYALAAFEKGWTPLQSRYNFDSDPANEWKFCPSLHQRFNFNPVYHAAAHKAAHLAEQNEVNRKARMRGMH